MAEKKTKAQLEAELAYLKKLRFSEGFIQISLSLIKFAALVIIARYGYLSIEALAGYETKADLALNVLGQLNFSITLAWAAAIGGLMYGFRQKKLRRDTIERLQDRIKKYESMEDPNRSSSHLTKRGETRKEDQL